MLLLTTDVTHSTQIIKPSFPHY